MPGSIGHESDLRERDPLLPGQSLNQVVGKLMNGATRLAGVTLLQNHATRFLSREAIERTGEAVPLMVIVAEAGSPDDSPPES